MGIYASPAHPVKEIYTISVPPNFRTGAHISPDEIKADFDDFR